MKNLIYTILLFAFTQSYAQEKSEFPAVGKPMQNFQLNGVQYYSEKKVSLNDFMGKWLILDFWNRYCHVCLKSFPKINSLQQRFKNNVQFLLVGYTGSQYTKKEPDNKMIRKIYKDNRRREDLQLAIAFDSVLFHRFDIRATPYIIIIDPEGIVRGITTSISEQNIDDLLAGKSVILKPADRFEERKQRIKERDAKKSDKMKN